MSKQHECTEEQLLNDVESHMMRPKMQANNTEVKPIFPESDEAGTVSWSPGDVAAIVNALLLR